jgi:hypothetical protein
MDRPNPKWYKQEPYCGKKGPLVRFFDVPALQDLYGKTNPGHGAFSNENDTRSRSKQVGRGKRNIRLDVHYEEASVAYSTRAHFPFFGLPPELRSIVYEHLLQHVLVRFLHVNTTVRVSTKEKRRSDWKALFQNASPGLPKWMLLNKQFLGEMVNELHRTAYFYQMQEHQPKRCGRVRAPLYLSLNQARRVRLLDSGFDIQAKTDSDGKRYYTFGADKLAECLLRQSILHLVFPQSHLQQLKVDFSYCAWELQRLRLPYEESVTVRSKLKFLERLPRNLKDVTLSFQGWTVVNAPTIDSLDCTIKDEMRRIARLLINENGSFTEEETYSCPWYHWEHDRCTGDCPNTNWAIRVVTYSNTPKVKGITQ